MSYLASDIINGALRLIGGGTFAAGETPSTSETADGLQALNMLLETWSLEQLMVFQLTDGTFATVGGTQSYTLGAGGNWNTPRPNKIHAAAAIVGTIRHPLKMLTTTEWNAVPERPGLTGVLPREMWTDWAAPLTIVWLSPVPSGIISISLMMWVALQQLALSSTALTLPTAYATALKYNLAVALAGEYDRPVPDNVAALAVSSKQAIITLNASNELGVLPTDLPPAPGQ